MLNVVMLCVANKPFMLSVFMLNVIMLSVVMLNVVAPTRGQRGKTFFSVIRTLGSKVECFEPVSNI